MLCLKRTGNVDELSAAVSVDEGIDEYTEENSVGEGEGVRFGAGEVGPSAVGLFVTREPEEGETDGSSVTGENVSLGAEVATALVGLEELGAEELGDSVA